MTTTPKVDDWTPEAKTRLLADVMAEPHQHGSGCINTYPDCDYPDDHTPVPLLSDSPADLATLNASVTDILMQPTLEQLQRRVITAARMLVEADDAEGTDWCHWDGLYECVMAEAKAAGR